jgi:hypothetical protein
MNVRFYVIVLLVFFVIGFFPKDSFEPVIPNSNTTNVNGTVMQLTALEGSNIYFIAVIVGIAICGLLIIFVLLRRLQH